MVEIIEFITSHWIAWLFAGVATIASAIFKTANTKLKERLATEKSKQKTEQRKNEAIAMGMQALLRDAIVGSFNKYIDKGYCPIYAKESVDRAYDAYHDLGGNDVASKLYDCLMKMPTKENGEREEFKR